MDLNACRVTANLHPVRASMEPLPQRPAMYSPAATTRPSYIPVSAGRSSTARANGLKLFDCFDCLDCFIFLISCGEIEGRWDRQVVATDGLEPAASLENPASRVDWASADERLKGFEKSGEACCDEGAKAFRIGFASGPWSGSASGHGFAF